MTWKNPIVICPHGTSGPMPATLRLLLELRTRGQTRGYKVSIAQGSADMAGWRSAKASELLHRGHDRIFWLDSDVSLRPSHLESMLFDEEDFVCAIYAKKTIDPKGGGVAMVMHEDVASMSFGPGAPQRYRVRRCATGCMATSAEVYRRLRRRPDMPQCKAGPKVSDIPIYPYFRNLIITETATCPDTGTVSTSLRMLGEDFSFCERWIQEGGNIWACTTYPVYHWGAYPYSYVQHSDHPMLCEARGEDWQVDMAAPKDATIWHSSDAGGDV